MAAAAILDLQKIEILTVDAQKEANIRRRAKFHQSWSNGWRDGYLTFFFKMAAVWICWAPIGATHDNHLVVSIVVPNLLKIDAVVSII